MRKLPDSGRLLKAKRRIAFFPLGYSSFWLSLLLLVPHSAFPQSAAEWSQIKAKCGISSSTAYNDWVAQGCPCNKNSAGSAAPAAIPALNPQQQLGMQIGTLGANMIGQGLHQMLAGKPVTPPDPAQQQLQLASQQLNNSGIWFLKQKKYLQAINEFEQALAKTPNDQTIRNNLAYARRLLEQSRKDGIAAAKNSNALANLLGANPPGSVPTSAGTPVSALNSIDLNSDFNVVDLRGTRRTAVDPAIFNKGSDTRDGGQLLTQQDLDAQFDKAMNASESESQADRTRLNADFDKAMNTSEEASQTDAQHLNAQFDKAYNDAAPHPDPAAPVTTPTPTSPQTVSSAQAVGQSQTAPSVSAANSSDTAGAPEPAAHQVQEQSPSTPAIQPANPNRTLSQSLDLPPGGVDFDGRGPGNARLRDVTTPALGSPRATSTTTQPSTRPAPQAATPRSSNSVDTRNLPSGLPKSLNDAINAAYPASLPGVSDRVRKGFQAVENHDWVTAQAFFQDALNHDPANASLKQFVELAGEAATSNPSADTQKSIWQQFMQLLAPPARKPRVPASVAAVRG